MSVRIGHTTLRVHPLLPILWAAAALSGNIAGPLGCASALALHETGHLLFARLLSIPVLSVELSPIGGLIEIEDPEGLSAPRGALLSVAGPLFSILVCYAASLIAEAGADMLFCRALAQSSLLLALINLLPALPLDGGCLVRYLLSPIFSWGRLSRILLWIGRGTAALLCGLALWFALQGEIILSPMLAGLYLLYAAEMESRQAVGRYVTALIARRQKLSADRALPVDILAVSASMPARRLLSQLRPGRYHFIRVVSPDGLETVGELDEKELCDLMLSSPASRIGDHIKKRPAKC